MDVYGFKTSSIKGGSHFFQEDVLGTFKTYWEALHADVPIAYPGVEFNPAEDVPEDDDAAWLRIWIRGNAEQSQTRYSNSLSTNFWMRKGRITFEVYAREDNGATRAYALVNDASKWLENSGCAFAMFGNISAPVEVGPDGTWFQVSISADWSYLTDRAA